MKEKIEKYFPKEHIGLAILIFSAIILYFALANYEKVFTWLGWFFSIFKPFIWGFVIAYFVNFFVRYFEAFGVDYETGANRSKKSKIPKNSVLSQ